MENLSGKDIKRPVKEIPILNCSEISGSVKQIQNTKSFKRFSEKLGVAMSEFGFVYLINHDVDSEMVSNVFKKLKEFFQLPRSIKEKYRRTNPTEVFHGYTPADEEILDEKDKGFNDMKECWDTWDTEALDDKDFPIEVPGFKKCFDKIRLDVDSLTKKLLRCFGMYLHLDDPDFFIKSHLALHNQTIKSPNVVRSNYYMPLEHDVELPNDALRLTEHSDWGTITLLFQDMIGGLEIKLANGEWISVPPIKGSIVLNAGLMLEMWSGGHFLAAPHRVRVIKEQACVPRQSLAYFIQPDGNSNCVPLVPEKNNWTPMYPKVGKETYKEYFQARIRSSRVYQ